MRELYPKRYPTSSPWKFPLKVALKGYGNCAVKITPKVTEEVAVKDNLISAIKNTP